MKLMSVSEHSDYLNKLLTFDSIKWHNHILRVAFGKQPLELWMFIPCDEEGNVLEEKSIFNTTDEDYIFNSDDFDKYQQAKERCLFEGFEFIESLKLINCNLNEFKKIEDLVKYDLQLTKTAIKQL